MTDRIPKVSDPVPETADSRAFRSAGADEPTGNLDSENGAQVMQLLADLHKGGATLCMVTHDPRYAQLAQRMVALLDGELVGELA